jgi:L-idonate 5-dehydrogenase
MVIAAAKVLGAKSITATDVLKNALERATNLGANKVINVSENQIPANNFDLVFECSAAAPAVTSALNAVKRAGTIVQLGMMGAQGQNIGVAPLVAKEITWKGSFRFNHEVDQAIEMLAANSWIGQAISHTFDLSDAIQAFEIAKDSAKSGKVLVKVN